MTCDVRRLSLPLVLVLVFVRPLAAAEDAAAAYARAVSLHQSGDLEAAVSAYRESLAASPRNPQARSNLGAALAALGRYEEAIAAYREALAVAPGDVAIRTNLALAHYKSADLPEAVRELEAVRAARPTDLRPALLLADCRLQMGEHTAAASLLQPLEAAHGGDRTLQYLLAMAAIRGGNAEEGGRRVERLMQGGDSAEAQYLLGSASFMAGDYPKAVEHFQQAKALAGSASLPRLRSFHGRALLFTGDPQAAEQEFRSALAESPNDYEAAYYLASILVSRGSLTEARPLAERALRLRPQSSDARALLGRLAAPGAGVAPASAAAGPAPSDSPLIGQAAPDVELRALDGAVVRLAAAHRGRPVLLAFGSFTCPQFRHGAPVLARLHQRYGGRVAFRLVYIREAHPEGEWQSTVNQREGVSLREARSESERAEHARLCRERLAIPYPALVDAMDGAAEKAFAAFPSRAFVVDRAGVVRYSTALDQESLREDALDAALAAVAR